MQAKIKVGILFGGQSVEHEVSVRSAQSIYQALDPNRYEPILIGINKQGEWHLQTDPGIFLNSRIVIDSPITVTLAQKDSAHTLVSVNPELPSQTFALDVIFPVLHGPLGEDGTVQGLFKMANMPFVGSGVLASSIGMDKDISKRLFQAANLPVAPCIVVDRYQREFPTFAAVVAELGLPFFIKPANLGSSVGVSKVKSKADFSKAINEALQYDSKILIEKFIQGRELECAVLGNAYPIASVPGELHATHEFYSYHAKYIDEASTTYSIPALISEHATQKIQALAIRAFQTIGCAGLARVDFFMQDNGDFYINEINTLPGFTSISMHPKMFAASGIEYADLLDRLIKLALERFAQEQGLNRRIDKHLQGV